MRERKRKGERERKRLAPPCPRVLSRNTSQNTIRRRKRDRNMFCSQKVCKNISWQFPLLPSLAGQAHGPSPMRFGMKNVIKAEECFFLFFDFKRNGNCSHPHNSRDDAAHNDSIFKFSSSKHISSSPPEPLSEKGFPSKHVLPRMEMFTQPHI